MKDYVPRLKKIALQDVGEMRYGNACYQKEDYEEATKAFEAALKINPELAGAHFMLGEVHLKQQLYSQAIQEFKRALQLKPELSVAYYKLGAAYAAQKSNNEAIHALQAALQSNPQLSRAHFLLGEIYSEELQYTEAIMHYKKAIQLKPDQPLVHYKLGKTYQAMGARFEAREAFQTVFNLRSQKNGRDSKHPVFPQTMGESSDFEADPVDHVPSVESEW